MTFLKKIQAAYMLKDQKAALRCVDYVLEHEADDFYDYVKDEGYKYEEWNKVPHIFASALKAVGIKPSKEDWGS